MRPEVLRRLINFWPPFLFSGIRIAAIDRDFRWVEVELRDRLINRNVQGSHYGGSLFSMTDPFYALMLRHALGPSYVIWDKRAAIDFVLPGRGTVSARFALDAAIVDSVRAQAAGGGKVLQDFAGRVVDGDGQVVATVAKTIYVRRRRKPEDSAQRVD